MDAADQLQRLDMHELDLSSPQASKLLRQLSIDPSNLEQSVCHLLRTPEGREKVLALTGDDAIILLDILQKLRAVKFVPF
jgi:hypothetical protein